MADDETLKVLSPELLQENPFPSQEAVVSPLSSSPANQTSKVYGGSTIQDQPLPLPRIATELLSNKLNTRTKKILAEFTFTPSGAIQIGDYRNGEAGDIRISPAGIVARNSLGDNTFTLDGETGDATFAGTIEAGTFIAGATYVGGPGVIIDGEFGRILISDGTTYRIVIGNV